MRSVPGLPIWLPLASQYPTDLRPTPAPDCSRVQGPPVIVTSVGAPLRFQWTWPSCADAHTNADARRAASVSFFICFCLLPQLAGIADAREWVVNFV